MRLEDSIKCPTCSEDYTHISKVELFFRDKEDSDTGIRIETDGEAISVGKDVSKSKGNPSGRREGMRIIFSCEFGHVFELVIQQHKGTNYVYTNFLRNDPDAHP